MYERTTATQKLLDLDTRIRAVAGGTSASKTISILMILIDTAVTAEGKLISIVSESMPHLKRGAMRDFLNIMSDLGLYSEVEWNRTDSIYQFNNGSRIEFFPADSGDKLRGARRDILFINEANNVPYDAFNQLEVRTKDHVWLDWNPTNEFWFYQYIKDNSAMDVSFVTLTYKDNEALDKSVVQAIESRKNNKAWWQVYGLGQLGEVEGKIYKGWQIIDEIPHEARLERIGLDFGYSNDPTAIVAVYRYNNGLVIDELMYRKGLSNKNIADFLLNLDYALVIADSAEPKSIDEIKGYGVPIIGATKGQGSISHGIGLVQEQRISVPKKATNLIREYRNYMWKSDRDGTIINTPMGFDDHLMDATRYAITSLGAQQSRKPKVYKPGEMLKRKYQ